jgi:indolepyruvate ferredoxin oxidoreductase beta subunit
VLERWCVCTHLARQTAHPFALIDLVAMKAGRAGARLAEIRAAGNSTIALDMILQLYLLGGLRRSRRGMLRHAQEQAHLAAWLAAAMGFLPDSYALSVEVIRMRRRIKGYSDTHARGQSKYDRVMQGVALVAGREDAADWARRLREAALQDEKGKALDGALETIRSFV